MVQLLVGLGAMVGGAHLFVEELLHVAETSGWRRSSSLILAPLATELPEKVNSFFWVREGKDSLALGNITGAMVFQSTIPVGIGLTFTDWELSGNAAISVALGLVGGLIAFWALRLRDRFEHAGDHRLARALRRLHRRGLGLTRPEPPRLQRGQSREHELVVRLRRTLGRPWRPYHRRR